MAFHCRDCDRPYEVWPEGFVCVCGSVEPKPAKLKPSGTEPAPARARPGRRGKGTSGGSP